MFLLLYNDYNGDFNMVSMPDMAVSRGFHFRTIHIYIYIYIYIYVCVCAIYYYVLFVNIYIFSINLFENVVILFCCE